MKTLKTLGFFLLMATGLMAQPDPNNMFIHGYVVDANGNAQANQLVCVYWNSNSPSFPSDSLCTTTNNNGYYFFDIQNGSLTGPSVNFVVTTDDPCSFLPLTQTVSNVQGTVNIEEVNFVICANSGGCQATISVSTDTTGSSFLYTFSGTATGNAPFIYEWWVNGSNGTAQTYTYQASANEIIGVCLTVTDNTGCTVTSCDTLYPNSGNPCFAYIESSLSPNGATTLEAVATGGTPPYTFTWGMGETTSSITVTNPDVYCVFITDATGCSYTACDTVGNGNPCNTPLDITTTLDSTGSGLVWTCMASPGFASYSWSTGETTQSITVQNANPNGEVVCVTASDNSGCTVTTCDTLLPWTGGGCLADFTYPGSPSGVLQVSNPLQLTFTGNMTNNSTITWTISGGGATFTATGPNPVFQIPPTLIPIGGINVEICVTVNDPVTNCSDTYCETLLAVPANTNACGSNYSWAPTNILGSPLPAIQFTDNSTNAAAWYWDFGDNTFSTDQNPIHAYNGTGTYTVCLTIVSADQSCTNTSCQTVFVGNNNGGCDASFSNSGPTPIGYTFSANVQDQNLYYYWEIDNAYVGNGYEAYAPGFTNGVHIICLTVIDSLLGCSDTQCLTITIGSPNCYGYISGQVYAGTNNNPLDAGVVYLITFDANTNQLTAVDSMVVDSGNFYFFGPLACGDYLIKAAAYASSQYYNSHIPTYYGNSPFWGFAQTVSIGQVNTQVTADITLIAANNPGGPGFIGGDVTEGANKMDPGDPLSGMQVMLFDIAGPSVAYTYTNANGEFGFSDLPWGTYQVYVEVLGVQTIPAVVTIGPGNPSEEGVHIFASETLISTGIAEFDFEGAVSDVYPNPVVNEASITFNLESEVSINISVLDLAGKAISSQTRTVAGGENTIRVNADELKNGYYILNIQDVEGKFSIARRFMRID